MKKPSVTVIVATCLWSMSVAAVLCAAVFMAIGPLEEDHSMLEKSCAIALPLTILPWVFAYAVTRVLYGIQSLMES